jgi:hypothetical protein
VRSSTLPLPCATHPRGRCLRVEDTEVLRIADYRPQLQVGARSVVIDGQLLDLRWMRVKNPVLEARTGSAAWRLYALCPACGKSARLLRRQRGAKGWSCVKCLRVIYPSQRRSGNGNRKGGPKPARSIAFRWQLQQERVARLLGLPQWPPQKLLWSVGDLTPQRPMSRHRRHALLMRLEALENLRIGALAGAGVLKSAGGPPTPGSPAVSALTLRDTQWALRES